MKFCVETSRGNAGDEIISRYPYLQSFNPIEVPYKDSYGDDKIRTYIEVVFLAEILDLIDRFKESIIIHPKTDWTEYVNGKYDCEYIIEIYDDWRE